MSWVWADSPSEGSDRLVLLAIADEANDQGYCWPGLPRLGRKARVSRRTVIRSIQALEAAGELLIGRGGKGPGDPNHYIVVMGRDVELLLGMFPESKGAKLAPSMGDSDDREGDNGGAVRVSPVAPDPTTNPPENPAGSAPLARLASPAFEDGEPGLPGNPDTRVSRETVERNVAGVAAARAVLHGSGMPIGEPEPDPDPVPAW